MIRPAAAALAPLAAALAVTGAATPAAVPFEGTATIKPFDVTKNCGGSSVSKKLFRVRCTQFGTFQGQAGAAGASLGWTWDLAVAANGNTTGYGTERATLILNFGTPGLLYLSLAGSQAPVGKGTPTSAAALTKGTWTVTKGTAAFAGRHGKGTYTFRTARTGSRTVFSVARLSLSGNLT
jgi:hypothetical protein